MTAEETLCFSNPDADPAEIARFLADLRARDFEALSSDDTVPHGFVALTEEEVVRQTNPVVWARDGRTPVALAWAGVQLYVKEL